MILDKDNNIILGETQPNIDNITWFKIVRRNNSPFFDSILRAGSTIPRPEFPFIANMPHWLIINLDAYASEEQYTKMKESMLNVIKENPNFIGEHFNQIEKDCQEFLLWAQDNKDNDNLLETYTEFKNKAIKMMRYLWSPLIPEEWLLQKIQDSLSEYIDPKENFEEFQRALNILMTPEESSDMQIEKEHILKIVIKGDYEKLSSHIENFGWVYDHNLHFSYPTEESLRNEIEKIENPQKELEEIEKRKVEVKKAKEEILQKYQFNKELLKLCTFAQRMPLIRLKRIEVISHTVFILKKVFKEISNNMETQELQLFCYWEIEQFLEGKIIDKEKAQERKEGLNTITQGNIFYEVNKEEAKELKKKVDSEVEGGNELKGQIACLGKATGIARVLMSAKENNKVNPGDILITSMTTPDFVPAMQKAAAIVTDEGGITCHAAIVSREMNIPCIIGTKKATKVFKDGDIVEVDATTGVIKKSE